MPSDKAGERLRLDAVMAARGLAASRARARDAILRGHVLVDGAPAEKPGQMIAGGAIITLDDPASAYVSRAALKLIAALDAFAVPVAGRAALDVGASTGGFTQVLLERGAVHVTAIDVGHGQLHPSIAGDPRVTAHEGLNARDLQREHLGSVTIGVVVSDVSFISLKLALPAALALAEADAAAVLLVKPQFEAGPAAIGKGGLLRDPADGPRVAEELRDWLAEQPGWRPVGLIPSPITGGDGNREFLLAGIKNG
ncbi:TlyA family RNA methyltransferase [Consotaella salsifontis]|uniref:23S rRNA (Cytidine1920-2'-O)/16S rRNA (Cytidine1409-2'-O)-methyltransferase n=1 Tax=Consotaella salsifontis TaxID=1365950 RepID=A0A1T4MYQ8_9HYPH|nr:TlyA family RNA methyltransferase [Consotaella salsifontis]SJZ72142.1 23S rRNA (cytidine1920-2'-O)/16S rRNA (cytidine1409-2'-O)-methyltransferase [Consotaella salsifontis]